MPCDYRWLASPGPRACGGRRPCSCGSSGGCSEGAAAIQPRTGELIGCNCPCFRRRTSLLGRFERLLELESVAPESHQASSGLQRADSASDQAAAPFDEGRGRPEPEADQLDRAAAGSHHELTRLERHRGAVEQKLGSSCRGLRRIDRPLGAPRAREPVRLHRPPGAGDQQLGQIEDKAGAFTRNPGPIQREHGASKEAPRANEGPGRASGSLTKPSENQGARTLELALSRDQRL